jgi:NMD protein affecting ribosome stability and mRNA decay
VSYWTRDLEQRCGRCSSRAVLEIMNSFNASLGRFCRRCGAARLRELKWEDERPAREAKAREKAAKAREKEAKAQARAEREVARADRRAKRSPEHATSAAEAAQLRAPADVGPGV